MAQQEQKTLVADIGGTHARFALIDAKGIALTQVRVYLCAEFDSLLSVIRHYLKELGVLSLKAAGLAIAGLAQEDFVQFTNLPWHFSKAALKEDLRVENLLILNDFEAIAYAMPHLTREEYAALEDKTLDPSKSFLVAGPGSGFGVAINRAQPKMGHQVFASEAGHMEFAASNEQEWYIHQWLARKFQRVSIERVLSGQGLCHIHEALFDYHDADYTPLKPEHIAEKAQRGECVIAIETVGLFFRILGRVLGDFLLAFQCEQVCIAGGIMPKLRTMLDSQDFLKHLRDKGRFQTHLHDIPVAIVTAPYPALIGLAACLSGKEAL